MVDSPDALIEEYLERLRQATAALPRQTRNEILGDIAEHLQAGLAGRPGTAAEVRTLLDDLGAPEQIAAAALDQLPGDTEPPRPANGVPPVFSLVLSVMAVSLTWIVWPLGVLCLWLSDAWTTRQKWLGTLVIPAGIWPGIWVFGWLAVGNVQMACSGGSVNGHVIPTTCSPPPWVPYLVDAALLVMVLAPFASAVYLGVVLIRGRIRRTAPARPDLRRW